jgi:hypothetical protein
MSSLTLQATIAGLAMASSELGHGIIRLIVRLRVGMRMHRKKKKCKRKGGRVVSAQGVVWSKQELVVQIRSDQIRSDQQYPTAMTR